MSATATFTTDLSATDSPLTAVARQQLAVASARFFGSPLTELQLQISGFPLATVAFTPALVVRTVTLSAAPGRALGASLTNHGALEVDTNAHGDIVLTYTTDDEFISHWSLGEVMARLVDLFGVFWRHEQFVG